MPEKLYELMDIGIEVAERLGLSWSDCTTPIDLGSETICGLGCLVLAIVPEDAVVSINTPDAVQLISEKHPQIDDFIVFGAGTFHVFEILYRLSDGYASVTDHPYTLEEQRDWLKSIDK